MRAIWSINWARKAVSKMGLPPVEQLDFGALIGVVEVVAYVPAADVENNPFSVADLARLASLFNVQAIRYSTRPATNRLAAGRWQRGPRWTPLPRGR
jgi:hypothetical protein